jgi:DNA repair protein RadC
MRRKIKDIPEQERPREKLLKKGPRALKDWELLAVLLGKGTAKQDVLSLAEKLVPVIDEKGLSVSIEDLAAFDGMGKAKAALVLAAMEFVRRRVKPEGIRIETPADLLPYIRHYADRKQEHFLCASVNGANEVINIRVVSIGLIDRIRGRSSPILSWTGLQRLYWRIIIPSGRSPPRTRMWKPRGD